MNTDPNNRAVWASLTHDSLTNFKIVNRPLNRIQFICLNVGLLLGNILVLFNTGAFASVSLHATGALGISPSHATWMQTYYFISLALALPVSSWAALVFGEVRLYLIAMFIMMLASLLCATTDNFIGFLIGRAVQGFFGGLTIPLSQSLLMREYPQNSKNFAVSLWSMAALSPFTLGPAAGGWLADHFGWRSLFFLNIPLSILSILIAWAVLFDRKKTIRKFKFDGIGFSLLLMALFCLQTVLNQGQDADWFNSFELIVILLVGILLMVYFIIWELGETNPLLNLRLFLRRNFLIGSLSLSFSFMLMYGLLALLLVRLQVIAGYTSFLAGSVLLPLVFLAKPMATIMHRIVHLFDLRLIASINMLLFSFYCFYNSRLDFFGRGSYFNQPLWSQVLEGFCLGGLFVPLTNIFLSQLKQKRQTQAVELGGMLRILGGSTASPIFGAFWERRSQFHQVRLLENLPLVSHWTDENIQHLVIQTYPKSLIFLKLQEIAKQHAGILALNDCFSLASWLFIGLAAFVWLAKPLTPKPIQSEKENVHLTALEDLVEEP